MASYHYTVTGIDLPIRLSEAASDHRAAQQEAVLFLSELLRDLAVSQGDGSEIRIEVRGPAGDLVCVASAQISSALP
jgi:hypothetical protein